MEIPISISPWIMPPAELKKQLESQSGWVDAGLRLELKKSKVRTRGLDPTILVALVGAVGTSLVALIAGLFQVMQKSAAGKIVVQLQSGVRLEFPANLKPEEIGVLFESIEKLGKLGTQEIILL